ncbi:MAG: UMP kinase [Halothiobacillus sp. 24-54-40]|jgi:uridylate kinase|nr:UMP kinase [Halothiobacillaceae bacterium]OYV47608.1 MAG: UMP kinase [Halothiobacillus sp. 20-53-49]OYY35496.1 MAG: UMP kinase [Halothiobacillus sp. 35-54-62]OYZ85732.1 MAG: UMP kinase [Halothiobacillus sp. 24-54-40]OZA79920.1 MAG: UMP kinase [Halothiobacillus sp. 39-53-45]HQS02671.1 UMP kinase [Halothiobacillus sp.]
MTDSTAPKYRRVLLKLSGEALMGDHSFGIDPAVIHRLAGDILQLRALGVEVGIVVGGGNIFRGEGLAKAGMDRVTGDQMGMLATVMNGLAMQDVIEQRGLQVRVMSALSIPEVCESFIRRRAIRHLEKGRIVILVGGTGNPFFTTDSGASLRAIEIQADIMIKATKVDGVYDADPKTNPNARRYTHLTYNMALDQRLGVMDATAIVLCRDQNMPMMVIDIQAPNNLVHAVMGKAVGTLVTAEETAK